DVDAADFDRPELFAIGFVCPGRRERGAGAIRYVPDLPALAAFGRAVLSAVVGVGLRVSASRPLPAWACCRSACRLLPACRRETCRRRLCRRHKEIWPCLEIRPKRVVR